MNLVDELLEALDDDQPSPAVVHADCENRALVPKMDAAVDRAREAAESSGGLAARSGAMDIVI